MSLINNSEGDLGLLKQRNELDNGPFINFKIDLSHYEIVESEFLLPWQRALPIETSDQMAMYFD